MAEIKNKCQAENCSRAASTHCFCCNKRVCTRHFTEHIEAVRAQIDPLANDVNDMVERLQCLTVEKITESSYAQLHQWRADMYQLIDEISLSKTNELEKLIETNTPQFVEHKKQQVQTLIKIQDEVKQLAEDGDATLEQIQLLKTRLNNVETNLKRFQRDFCSISTKVFAQGLVTVASSLKKTSATSTHEGRRRAQQQQQQTADLKPANSLTAPTSFGPKPAYNPTQLGFSPTRAASSTSIFGTPITTASSTAYGVSSSTTISAGTPTFSFGALPTTYSPPTPLFGTPTTTSVPSFSSCGTVPTFSFSSLTSATTRSTSSNTTGLMFDSSASPTASVSQPSQQPSPFSVTGGFFVNNTGQK